MAAEKLELATTQMHDCRIRIEQ